MNYHAIVSQRVSSCGLPSLQPKTQGALACAHSAIALDFHRTNKYAFYAIKEFVMKYLPLLTIGLLTASFSFAEDYAKDLAEKPLGPEAPKEDKLSLFDDEDRCAIHSKRITIMHHECGACTVCHGQWAGSKTPRPLGHCLSCGVRGTR